MEQQLKDIRAQYAKMEPEQLKVIDPCMGSGHILCYLFDVLMQIYLDNGYSKREAVRSILKTTSLVWTSTSVLHRSLTSP